jgi:hypothetical protein
MPDPVLPLLRLRLELDRTLRTRHFIQRALRGGLTREQARDLGRQLAALAAASGDGTLEELAHDDFDSGSMPPPCSTARAFADAIPRCDLEPEALRAAVVAALGTSWLLDAGSPVRESPPSRFFPALYGRSCAALDELRVRLVDQDPEPAYAVSELARGAVLGVVTYLETRWLPDTLPG